LTGNADIEPASLEEIEKAIAAAQAKLSQASLVPALILSRIFYNKLVGVCQCPLFLGWLVWIVENMKVERVSESASIRSVVTPLLKPKRMVMAK